MIQCTGFYIVCDMMKAYQFSIYITLLMLFLHSSFLFRQGCGVRKSTSAFQSEPSSRSAVICTQPISRDLFPVYPSVALAIVVHGWVGVRRDLSKSDVPRVYQFPSGFSFSPVVNFLQINETSKDWSGVFPRTSKRSASGSRVNQS